MSTNATTQSQGDRPAKKAGRVEHLSVPERVARGKATRAEVPRSVHAAWEPASLRRSPVELMEPKAVGYYANVCGTELARSHAGSGDAIAISSYLGNSDSFDRALALFAESYANQNERDYKVLKDAVEAGELKAETGI